MTRKTNDATRDAAYNALAAVTVDAIDLRTVNVKSTTPDDQLSAWLAEAERQWSVLIANIEAVPAMIASVAAVRAELQAESDALVMNGGDRWTLLPRYAELAGKEQAVKDQESAWSNLRKVAESVRLACTRERNRRAAAVNRAAQEAQEKAERAEQADAERQRQYERERDRALYRGEDLELWPERVQDYDALHAKRAALAQEVAAIAAERRAEMKRAKAADRNDAHAWLAQVKGS